MKKQIMLLIIASFTIFSKVAYPAESMKSTSNIAECKKNTSTPKKARASKFVPQTPTSNPISGIESLRPRILAHPAVPTHTSRSLYNARFGRRDSYSDSDTDQE